MATKESILKKLEEMGKIYSTESIRGALEDYFETEGKPFVPFDNLHELSKEDLQGVLNYLGSVISGG